MQPMLATAVPTLHNGDRVLVNKLAFDFGQPKTGEIIVFQSPVWTFL
jgi:signal peptidase I